MHEPLSYLGLPGPFTGDDDLRAPQARALDWIWRHSGLMTVQLAEDERAILLIDLVGSRADLAIVGPLPLPARSKRQIEGDGLAEVIEAGAELLACYATTAAPEMFDGGGDGKRVVAFLNAHADATMIAAWSKMRGRFRDRAEAR